MSLRASLYLTVKGCPKVILINKKILERIGSGMETNQLMEDAITVLSLDNEKLKRKYFFATKQNYDLKKALKEADTEIDKLNVEYKRLTKMLSRLDKGRI